MARTTATNFTGTLQFPYATASADLVLKEDIQTLALAVDGHDHTPGKGLAPAFVELLEQSSSPATPAAGHLRLYAKTDHHLYIKDSTGLETRVI
jgi:hypothetical protein